MSEDNVSLVKEENNAIENGIKDDVKGGEKLDDIICTIKDMITDKYNHNEVDSFNLEEVLAVIADFKASSTENNDDTLSKLQEDNKRLTENLEEINLSRDKSLNELKCCNEKMIKLEEENKRLATEVASSESKNMEKLTEALKSTVERLEQDVALRKRDTADAQEKLTSHDAAAKRAIAVLQKENAGKMDQIQKEKDELSEKLSKIEDEYIIKMSKLEAIIEELQMNTSIQNKKTTGQHQEVEKLRSSLKSKDLDISKLTSSNETLEKNVTKLNKKVEQQKEEIGSHEMKMKWAQNKLKQELDAHKETKKQIAGLNSKIKESKEEGAQIRQNCQMMIQRYQADEEIESVRLKNENKEKDGQIKEFKEVVSSLQEKEKLNSVVLEEMYEKRKLLEDENNTLNIKLKKVEDEMKTLSNNLEEKEKDIGELKNTVDSMKCEVALLTETQSKCTGLKNDILDYSTREENCKLQIEELELEITTYKEKQHELMTYTQNLTENNATSKSIATDLQTKLDQLMEEKEEAINKLSLQIKEKEETIAAMKEGEKELSEKIEEVNNNLEQKSRAMNELSDSLSQAQDDLKIIKKKNQSQVKDLQKQLAFATRRLDKYESGGMTSKSRTSSCSSIEKLSDSPPDSSPNINNGMHLAQDHYISQPRNTKKTPGGELEIEQHVLVEKICKLQRVHAKKNERIEFLEEHVNHLTEDLQKKAKIIQFYIQREDGESLVPNRSDKNKARLAKHGGIMASVYSAKATDKAMTFELSLQINSKLQSVLEDTILKNMMLKENINTLGIEIAKLQDEIREYKK